VKKVLHLAEQAQAIFRIVPSVAKKQAKSGSRFTLNQKEVPNYAQQM
jgi:hypothetical protein